jgi:hypothetical protein
VTRQVLPQDAPRKQLTCGQRLLNGPAHGPGDAILGGRIQVRMHRQADHLAREPLGDRAALSRGGSPARAPTAARRTARRCAPGRAAAGGSTSWYGFARAIFDSPEMARLGVTPAAIEAIPTSAYPTPARRPANSRLACGRVERRAGVRLAPWGAALRSALAEVD